MNKPAQYYLFANIWLLLIITIAPVVGQSRLDTLLARVDTASSLAQKSMFTTDISQYYWAIDPNQSVNYGLQALKLGRESGDTSRIGYALNAIGHAYSLKSNYTTATTYLLEALQLFEASGNTSSSMSVYNNLGIIYTNQNHQQEALRYFMPYYEHALQDPNHRGLAPACANIGVVYYHLEKFDSALFFQEQYLTLSQEAEDNLGVAIATSNLADIYYGQKQYDKALTAYQEAEKMSEALDDVEGVIITLSGEGKVWVAYNKPHKALPLLERSLALSSKYQLPNYQKDNYAQLARAYEQLGDYKKALSFTDAYIELKDSLFNQSNTQQLNALQESYTIAKKEAEILDQQTSIELLNKSKEVNQLIGLMMGMGLVMLGILAVVLLRNNRVKQRINQQLQASKEEIQLKTNAIEAHNEELQQQQEEIIAQRDALNEQSIALESAFGEISKQNTNIMSSITYAQRIQAAMMPSKEQMAQVFPAHTLLYLPKNIVSGDFYFMRQVNDHTVIAVVDCTGHGVSGAFMSMIGNELLNEAVRVKGMTQPDLILTYLDQGIRNTLQQEQSKNRDGMDIACCTLLPDGVTLQYAGAKNPLVYIDREGTHIIKGDKRSIGGFVQSKKGNLATTFTLHEIKLKERTSIYMFSDGYQDQFSSVTGRKIGPKNLIALLEKNDRETPWEQRRAAFNYYLLDWQCAEKQIDDVLILGIEIDPS